MHDNRFIFIHLLIRQNQQYTRGQSGPLPIIQYLPVSLFSDTGQWIVLYFRYEYPLQNGVIMTNYKVELEAAWLVREVKTAEDAMAIALSESGKRLNPKLDYVDVEIGTLNCASCNDEFMSVFLVADTALVGLILSIRIYEADSEEHASRIAKSVIGRAFRDVPLKVISVEPF